MSDDLAEKLLIGAGLAGLGYLAWQSYEKRKTFHESLSKELESLYIRLVYADLGRLPDGRHAWHLTLDIPSWGADTLCAPLEPGTDPYGETTRQNLVRRVGTWVEAQPA